MSIFRTNYVFLFCGRSNVINCKFLSSFHLPSSPSFSDDYKVDGRALASFPRCERCKRLSTLQPTLPVAMEVLLSPSPLA